MIGTRPSPPSPSTQSPQNFSRTPHELRDLIFSFGKSSTCFLTLYPGFKYFKIDHDGFSCIIPYADTPTAWIGAGDPIGPPALQPLAIEAFIFAAKKQKKAAAMLPISMQLAKKVRSLGLYALQIGSEPWQSTGKFSRTDALNNVEVARRLAAKGAKVEAFDPYQITGTLYDELDELTLRWLASRPTVPLSFLNRVAPWFYSEEKRYFLLQHHGRVMGFISAIPIPARQAWYLVDLIRAANAPVGTTELLVIEAIELLKAEGAQEVTLGMSPLVPPDVQEQSQHPRTYHALETLFSGPNWLYSFETLFEYKSKFKPNHWEAQYLIASPSMNLRVGYGLFWALFPQGIKKTLAQTVRKKSTQWRLPRFQSKWLSKQIVLRDWPADPFECFSRCKSVINLAGINLLLYFTTIEATSWHIRPMVEHRYGFSVNNLLHGGGVPDLFINLIVSSFLHWKLSHLILNLLVLLIFGGTLELLAGSTIVLLTYCGGILLSNPISSLLIYGSLKSLGLAFADTFANQVDIGCSLGVFACLGLLFHFLEKTRIIATFMMICIIIYAFLTHSLMNLNHVTALAIGLICGQLYVSKK